MHVACFVLLDILLFLDVRLNATQDLEEIFSHVFLIVQVTMKGADFSSLIS